VIELQLMEEIRDFLRKFNWSYDEIVILTGEDSLKIKILIGSGSWERTIGQEEFRRKNAKEVVAEILAGFCDLPV